MTDRMPGLRLHPRTLRVQSAENAIARKLIEMQGTLELTDVEMLRAIMRYATQITTGILRAERHPEDPGMKADEE